MNRPLPHSADIIDADDLAYLTTLATCTPEHLAQSIDYHDRTIGAALDSAIALGGLNHVPVAMLMDAAESVVCGAEYFLALHTRWEA